MESHGRSPELESGRQLPQFPDGLKDGIDEDGYCRRW